MCEKTARKYRNLWEIPSNMKKEHDWRTRQDPFESVWEESLELLKINPGLEAKTIFKWLQDKYPEEFQDGQLRTFQRKVKNWRALYGPSKEVFFSQIHTPGQLCQSDFTSMNSLEITIQGQKFQHIFYHFVLTYSNWETGTVCFSESYESVSTGLQNALFHLGGVPEKHQTDSLSAAVINTVTDKNFTERYAGLIRHYGLAAQKTNPKSPNENGDIECRNRYFKSAVNQALMIRGSRDFNSREEYENFLKKVIEQLNSGRVVRLKEELGKLKELPERRLEDHKEIEARVTSNSTIRVQHNTYSVHSRLIGEKVKVRIHMEKLEVRHSGKKVEEMLRLRGENKHSINYRHVIDWLVRKPGAFEAYCYKEDMFPTSTFKVTYDMLSSSFPSKGSKEYLKILHLAATESESLVEQYLKECIDQDRCPDLKEAKVSIEKRTTPDVCPDIQIIKLDINEYDELLSAGGL
ncbi:MAG: IS21 family transposase [Kiritimatiellae bacterium]|nr:IS21 family transposase [Kiritimatiellia bacterium]